MKAFLAGTVFFVALNLVAAGVVWIVIFAARHLEFEIGESMWPATVAMLFAIAAAILFGKFALSLIGRLLSKDRARG